MDGEKKTLINDVKSMLELNFIATFNLYAFVISLTFFPSFTLFFNNLLYENDRVSYRSNYGCFCFYYY